MYDDIAFKAIDKCISKYKKYSKKRSLKNVSLGPETCSLCDLYFVDLCKRCPVKEITGEIDCGGSPYGKIWSALQTGNLEDFKNKCLEEVKFLEEAKEWMKGKNNDVNQCG